MARRRGIYRADDHADDGPPVKATRPAVLRAKGLYLFHAADAGPDESVPFGAGGLRLYPGDLLEIGRRRERLRAYREGR